MSNWRLDVWVFVCICDLILVISCSPQVCFLTFLALFSTPEIDKYALASNHINHSVVSDSLRPSWNVAHHAPLFMGFSTQGNWSALPFPPPGDLPDSGIEPPLLHCMPIIVLATREAPSVTKGVQKRRWWQRSRRKMAGNRKLGLRRAVLYRYVYKMFK